MEEPAEKQTPTPAEPTRDEAGEKPERRGRGRGQGRKSKENTVAGEVAAPAGEPAAPADELDSDAEELRSLSNWDVPSWNELIASLYRPGEPSRREERHGRRDH